MRRLAIDQRQRIHRDLGRVLPGMLGFHKPPGRQFAELRRNERPGTRGVQIRVQQEPAVPRTELLRDVRLVRVLVRAVGHQRSRLPELAQHRGVIHAIDGLDQGQEIRPLGRHGLQVPAELATTRGRNSHIPNCAIPASRGGVDRPRRHRRSPPTTPCRRVRVGGPDRRRHARRQIGLGRFGVFQGPAIPAGTALTALPRASVPHRNLEPEVRVQPQGVFLGKTQFIASTCGLQTV